MVTASSYSTSTRGLLLGRYLKALGAARGDPVNAHAYAQGQAWSSTPEVAIALKAAIAPLDQADADNGLAPIANDLVEVMRPMSIVGRLIGLRKVPFACRLLAQQIGGTGAFVEEGRPIPISAAGMDEVAKLEARKVSAVRVLTRELVQSAVAGSELLIANEAAGAVAEALDRAFVAPDNVGSEATPASITHDAPTFGSSGSTLANIDSDLGRMVKTLTDSDCSLMTAAWLMAPRTSTYLSLLRGSSGAPAYPGVTARGGTLLGLPVLTSRNVDSSGSPSDGFITLVEASEIAIADEGTARIEVASHASVQMSDGPAAGAQQLVSFWQLGLVGVKGTRLVNWARLRSHSVVVLADVAY